MANQTQQTTQTAQQHNDATRRVHPDFASVESTDGVAFSKGNMLVNGAPQLPDVVQDWKAPTAQPPTRRSSGETQRLARNA